MHKLQRGVAPACLARYKHGRDQWSRDVPTVGERTDIWNKLEQMQGARCAYCEAGIITGPRHIEHFRQRDRYPQGTFDWTNLFGSCDRGESCGKHKDKCGYTPVDLIKPDVDEPDDYFVFVSDGTIAPRAGLKCCAATTRHRNPARLQSRCAKRCSAPNASFCYCRLSTNR